MINEEKFQWVLWCNFGLSKKETMVVDAILKGKTSKEMEDEIGISQKTIELCKEIASKKLGMSFRDTMMRCHEIQKDIENAYAASITSHSQDEIDDFFLKYAPKKKTQEIRVSKEWMYLQKIYALRSRGIEIAQLLHEGKTNEEIAQITGTKISTVKFNLREIRRSMSLNSQEQILLMLKKLHQLYALKEIHS